MGASCNWPNYDAWLQTAWGAGMEFWVAGPCGGLVIGPVLGGSNPPYALDDFLAMYPKFFGAATSVPNCTITAGSATFSVANTAGLATGQLLSLPGVLAPGSLILTVGMGSVVLNNQALASAAGVAVAAYEAPPLPLGVIQAYINLATASLNQALWQEQWTVAMGWFVAHYCTLYAETDVAEMQTAMETVIHGEAPTGAVPGTVYTLSSAPPGGALQALVKNGVFQTPGVDYTLSGVTVTLTMPTVAGDTLYVMWPVSQQTNTPGVPTGAAIAAQGVANGILTSKAVGDVSASYQALTSLEDWGAWNLTKYGQMLATMAKVVGAGPALIW